MTSGRQAVSTEGGRARSALPRPRTWVLLSLLVLLGHAALLAPAKQWLRAGPAVLTGPGQAAPGSASWTWRTAVAATPPQGADAPSQPHVTPAAPATAAPVNAASVKAVQATTTPAQPMPRHRHRTTALAASELARPDTAPAATPIERVAVAVAAHAPPSPPADAGEPPLPPPATAAPSAAGGASAAPPTAPAPPAKALAATVSRLPPSARLRYNVQGEARHIPYSAQAELLWQHDLSSYTARLTLSALLLTRTQTSVGQLSALGLEPLRFGDKLRTEVAAHFERDKGRVIFSANTPDALLQPGAQDRLSVLLQLGALLGSAAPPLEAGARLSLQTVGPRDADDWHFLVGSQESLSLPQGPHTAVKLSKQAQRDYDLQVDVWLAQDLHWLPVQLRMTQANGDMVLLQLQAVDRLP